MKELTKGNLYKNFLLFLLPVFASNVIFQLFNTVDSLIVSNTVGSIAFAGIGVTSSASFFIIQFVIGLTGGFSVCVSQKFGAGNEENLRRTVAMNFTLGAILSVAITALAVPLTGPILRLLNTPDLYFDYAYWYLFVLFCGLPVTIFYYITSGILRAIGDSRSPLYFMLLASVLNVGLTYLFIVSFDMHYVGAALGTVVSRAIAVVGCFVYTFKKYECIRLKKRHFQWSGALAMEHIKIGLPMAIQFSITGIGMLFCSGAVNGLEGQLSGVILGHSAATKVNTLIQCFFVALGTTVANVVGQNYGAKEYGRIRQTVRIGALYGGVYCVLAFLFSFFGGELLMGLFIGEELGNGLSLDVVLGYGKQFLFVQSIAYVFQVTVSVFRNALQSMGRSFVAMFAGIMELIARALGAFVLVNAWGYLGACLFDPFAWVLATLFLVAVYFILLRKGFEKGGRIESCQRDENLSNFK